MKYSFTLAALAALAFGKEIPKDEARAAELYDSGVMHDRIMSEKFKQWDAMANARASALADPYVELHFAQCKDGKSVPFRDQATFFFRCNNMNLHHFLPHSMLGSQTGQGSSSWGWTSDDGREFAIIAQADGAAFAEVILGGKLRYLGRLPQTPGAAAAIWREIRVFKHYIVVGSESYNHHIQIFDLKKLLDIDYRSPVVFDPATDITGFYGNLPDGRAHNVLANDASGFAYVVGARPRTSECRSGLIFLDLKDPSKPEYAGCAAMDGYVHDAQCLIYKGPHTKYLVSSTTMPSVLYCCSEYITNRFVNRVVRSAMGTTRTLLPSTMLPTRSTRSSFPSPHTRVPPIPTRVGFWTPRTKSSWLWTTSTTSTTDAALLPTATQQR
ncbi:hypothetical protein MCOR25_009756 [Pyricularia grisea]|nr:hypothetical protein MCOR25_009756 [Pyricularia grisea]